MVLLRSEMSILLKNPPDEYRTQDDYPCRSDARPHLSAGNYSVCAALNVKRRFTALWNSTSPCSVFQDFCGTYTVSIFRHIGACSTTMFYCSSENSVMNHVSNTFSSLDWGGGANILVGWNHTRSSTTVVSIKLGLQIDNNS